MNNNPIDPLEKSSVSSTEYQTTSSEGIVTSDQVNKTPTQMAKALVAIALLVVVGGSAAYIGLHHNQAPASKAVATEGDEIPFKYQATVVIQNHQVEPSTINVLPQTDLFIENHDSVDYHIDTNQLNSNNTFTIPFNGKTFSYVEDAFASNVTVAANGGYNYVFVNKGTYFFHDINDSSISGEVIVN